MRDTNKNKQKYLLHATTQLERRTLSIYHNADDYEITFSTI